jgi:septum formation protein
MDIILASASPRRRELLQNIGLRDFKIIPAKGNEHADPGLAPEETVCKLSSDKAKEVAALCGRDDIIIAADTVVALNGEILGKPRDGAQAAEMLKKLSGAEHTVFTGVTVISGGTEITDFMSTLVRFRVLTDREIAAYVATGEPMDKAGAYGVQGVGSLFVEGITGDFFNVMGLPVCLLSKMLEKLGVRLI